MIGGGVAGLVAAYCLADRGVQVVVYEGAPFLGGQAASFELAPNETIERFYHFICRGDDGYLHMLDELGIRDRLRWRTTEMGFFYRGELHTLGDPISLLRFPHLSTKDKIRFARTTLAAKWRSPAAWEDLEDVNAIDWLTTQYGERTYRMLYEPLLTSKFQHRSDTVSAAWMWARLNRLGNSRSVTMKERIGYLEGGSQTYVDALAAELTSRGVELRTATPVERIVVEHDRVRGVQVGGQLDRCDGVISTVPIPRTSGLFAGLHGPYFDNLRSLEYFGVTVMVFRLNRRFSPYYWTNVSDPRVPMSGVIEATNLNPRPDLGGDSILYVPQYMDPNDPRFSLGVEEVFEQYCDALSLMNSSFDQSWVVGHWLHRERFTQPLCEVGFSERIPEIRTPIANLLVTDSYQLNPHDRAISFSTDLGRRAASFLLEDLGG